MRQRGVRSGWWHTAVASLLPQKQGESLLPVLKWNPSTLIRRKSTRCLFSVIGTQWQPLKSHWLQKWRQGGSTCPLKNMPWGYLPWTCRVCTDDILISWVLWYIFNRACGSLQRTVHQCPHLIGFSHPPAHCSITLLLSKVIPLSPNTLLRNVQPYPPPTYFVLFSMKISRDI